MHVLVSGIKMSKILLLIIVLISSYKSKFALCGYLNLGVNVNLHYMYMYESKFTLYVCV